MDDPMSYYNDPQLIQAQGASNQAMSGYKTAVTNAATLPDLLKQALDKKFSSAQENPLVASRNEAATNYLTKYTEAPLSVLPENNQGMIFSPNEQAAMIEGRRSGALLPLLNANSLLAGQTEGVGDIITRATKMYETLAKTKQIEAEQARQKYQDLLDLVEKKVSQASTDRAFKENVRQFGLEYALRQAELAKGSAADQSRARYGSMVSDIKGKMTLRNLLAKYGADFTPDEIYGIYNAQSPWGPAKESGDILSKLGISSTETADIRNRKEILKPALLAVKNVKVNNLKEVGTAKANGVLGKMNFPTGLGKMFVTKDEQNLVSIHQQFELLKQNVVRALQGARMSDTDIEMAKGYIPSIQDTPETVKTKLKNLDNFINNLSGSTMESSRPPLSSFDY